MAPNDSLHALDEVSGSIVLSEFAVQGLNRYVLHWPRAEPAFVRAATDTLERLHAKDVLPALQCVTAWRYGVPADLKFRHGFIASKLTGRGWDVEVQPSLAVATSRVAAGQLSRVVEETQVGWLPWFVAWDAWASPSQIVADPFRAVVLAFARNKRLAPSREFLEAIRGRVGGIGYLVDTDAGNPRLVLLTASMLCARLVKEMPTCKCVGIEAR